MLSTLTLDYGEDYILLEEVEVKKVYQRLVKNLFSLCDTIVFADIHESILSLLKPFEKALVFEDRRSAWAGTELFGASTLLRGYKPVEALFDLFQKESTFFDDEGCVFTFGSQIDLSFYQNEVCLLFTISHERLVYLKRDCYEKLLR